jgi:DNA-binding NtrC family response regulator
VSARRPRLLIVDDGERATELAHALLRDYDYATRCTLRGPCWECSHRQGCTLTHAHDYFEAREALTQHRDVDAVLLDVAFDLGEQRLLRRPDWELERCRRLQGLLILAQLRRSRPELPVVLMTSQDQLELEHAAEALAADELVTLAGREAFDARALSLLIERVLGQRARAGHAGDFYFGDTRAMARLRQQVSALAPTSLPMLLLGETGTGKSALAELVHAESGRRGPLVHVDLAALPENLLPAELFGTVRGAFSGAVDRRGRFEQAAGGTLFLDEIGNLPLEAQRTLLLALQTGRVSRLGEGVARAVDVKVIAATNGALEQAVREGRFRADLYARLNPAARVTLPPLRERSGDVPALAELAVRRAFARGSDAELLARYCEAAGLSGPPAARLQVGAAPDPDAPGVAFAIAPRTLAQLQGHGWPGNVRELSLVMASACVLVLGDALRALSEQRGARGEAARVLPLPAKLISELLASGWLGAAQDGASAAPRAGEVALQLAPAAALNDVSRTLERQVFERLFAETGGDFEQMAARLLLGSPRANARKVRLRFNQLGLRARERRRGGTR